MGLVLAGIVVELLYFMIRQSPQHWWIITWAVFMVLFIVLAQIAPVVLFPIFYKFEPLENEDLRRRLVQLSEHAGTRVRGVYRWKLSEKSKKANAALTGLGRTRRIILADTLLDNYAPEEIEAVLAHELGHHVHRHILKSIFVQAGITLLGFWVANWVLHYTVDHHMFNLEELSDFANLPLLALTATALSLLLMPALNAYSRYNERQADRYAFESIASVEPFISSMNKLAQQNLAERTPSKMDRGAVPLASRNLETCGGCGGLGPRGGCGHRRSSHRVPSTQSALAQNLRHSLQVFLGVNSNRVVRRLADVDFDSVFEETQLFQPFAFFEYGFRLAHKKIERGLPVGVETEVLEVARAGAIAVEGNRGSRKIERAAVRGSHNFDCVRIADVFRWARSLHRSHLHGRVFHHVEQRGNLFGAHQRFVALHVDVHIRRDRVRHFMHALGSAAVGRGGHLRLPTMRAAGFQNLFGIRSDDHVGEKRRRADCLVDPTYQRLAGDLAQHFARETSRR